MPATEQAERINVASKAAELREKKEAEAKAKELAEAKLEKPEYDNTQVTMIVSALLAADKQRLLDFPGVINKAKQIVDLINE